MAVTEAVLRRIAVAINTAFDEQEAKALIESLNSLNDNVPPATTAVVGGVKKASAVTDVTGTAGATYTAAEQTLINSLKTQLNALLAALRTAGVISA